MKNVYLSILFFAALIMATDSSWGRPFRVGQIPNGNKFQCANCHIDPQGGGARNNFGTTIENNFLVNGDVQWQAALALMDSDGDGKTNGQELQDPSGSWRIGDPAPGVFNMVTNPGVLDALFPPTLTSPSNNSTGSPIQTILSWNAVNNATGYRVEVAEASDFVNLAFSQDPVAGTTVTTSPLKSKTPYYWRVRSVSADAYSDWSQVLNFTTKFAAPIPVEPANNANGMQAPVKLVWKGVAGAPLYEVELALTNSFSNPVETWTGIADTSVTVNALDINKVYFWRVRAGMGTDQSDWSPVMSFSTTNNGPILVSPENLAFGQGTTLNLVWNKLTGFNSYNVEVSDSIDFSNPIFTRTGLTDTTVEIEGLQNNTRYFWRVNAGANPNQSEWSAIRSFTTKFATPVLLQPENELMGLDTTLNLIWMGVPGASLYNIVVSTNADFTSPVFSRNDVADTTAAVGGLNYNTRYYWRVSAGEAPGTSDWSESRTFRTGYMPPTLNLPADDSSGLGKNVFLTWNFGMTGEFEFEVQVDTTLAFTSPSFTTTDNAFATADLNQLTKYYWRVRANRGDTLGVWSAVRIFSTGLEAPVLTYPENNSQNLSTQFEARWNPNPIADRYQVQLASDSGFNDIILNDNTITQPQMEFGNLTAGATYYWRVRAMRGESVSDWSMVWSFTTGENVPVLLSPENGATNQPLTLTLMWSNNPNAVGYHFQVAYDEQFTNILLEESGAPDTTETLTDLQETTTYYWRVRSIMNAGPSAWSETRSFRTLKQGYAEDRESVFVKISPNPASGVLHAEFNFLRSDFAKVYVMDALGRVCLDLGSREIGSGAAVFDISPLPAGSYRLIIASNQGTRSIGFIKLD